MNILPALATLLAATALYQRLKPLPPGLSLDGPERPADNLRLLTDLTFADQTGNRCREQEIFDECFAIIGNARSFLLLDLFFFNSFKGYVGGGGRPLAEELTALLLARKGLHPEMTVIVISDPINTAYGSIDSHHFARLRAAGITVVLTRLDRLRDSNPLYSCWWHLLVRPWGSGPGRLVANPFDPGRMSLRSFLRLLNFKANHRKVMIADHGEQLVGLVSSANPHGASSDHTNVALRFSGPAVMDLLASEQAVLAFSGGPPAGFALPAPAVTAGQGATVRILTEGAIKRAVLTAIGRATAGDRIDLLMFYLADRRVIRALEAAHLRGARLRLLLDPSKDAFGRAKGGIPNRQVGYELHRREIPVRWADTRGEQCHAKMLLVTRGDGESQLILGSANFTRRNLDDFNLETDVAVRGRSDADPLATAARFFDTLWHNREGRQCSLPFHAFNEPSPAKRLLSRLLEATGLSTF